MICRPEGEKGVELDLEANPRQLATDFPPAANFIGALFPQLMGLNN